MKDSIGAILWGIYSIGFGLLITTLEGKEPFMEKFGIGFLVAQIVLGFYMLIIMIINGCILSTKLRFKLSPPKRFKTKVTPIYKVTTYEETNSYFSIGKYELAWIDFNSSNSRFYLLPFVTLFQRYRYQAVEFLEFEQKLEESTDIESSFEAKFAEKNKKQIEGKTAKQRELDKINNLNKVFKQNYE